MELAQTANVTHDQGQSPSPFGINQKQCRNGRYHLDCTVAKRGIQGLRRGISDVLEDSGAVEGDDCGNQYWPERFRGEEPHC